MNKEEDNGMLFKNYTMTNMEKASTKHWKDNSPSAAFWKQITIETHTNMKK